MNLVKIVNKEGTCARYLNFDFLEKAETDGSGVKLTFTTSQFPVLVEGSLETVVSIINMADGKHYLTEKGIELCQPVG